MPFLIEALGICAATQLHVFKRSSSQCGFPSPKHNLHSCKITLHEHVVKIVIQRIFLMSTWEYLQLLSIAKLISCWYSFQNNQIWLGATQGSATNSESQYEPILIYARHCRGEEFSRWQVDGKHNFCHLSLLSFDGLAPPWRQHSAVCAQRVLEELLTNSRGHFAKTYSGDTCPCRRSSQCFAALRSALLQGLCAPARALCTCKQSVFWCSFACCFSWVHGVLQSTWTLAKTRLYSCKCLRQLARQCFALCTFQSWLLYSLVPQCNIVQACSTKICCIFLLILHLLIYSDILLDHNMQSKGKDSAVLLAFTKCNSSWETNYNAATVSSPLNFPGCCEFIFFKNLTIMWSHFARMLPLFLIFSTAMQIQELLHNILEHESIQSCHLHVLEPVYCT